MKKTNVVFILFIILFSCKNERNTKPKELDIISYDIKIQFDTLNKKLNIESIINFEKPDSLDKIDFLFLDFASIKEIKQNNTIDKDFIHQNDTLSIKVSNKNKIDLFIKYTLPIDSFGNNEIITLTRPMKWCPFVYDDISIFKTTTTVPANFKVYSSGDTKIQEESNAEIIFKSYNKLNSGLPLIIANRNYYRETEKELTNMKVKFYFHNKDSVLTN